MGLSVGIGLTNDCNLQCAHCYRPTDRIYALGLTDIKTICDALPVSSMGMGTGENALHPEFLKIVAYLQSRQIKLTIASNGYSLNTMPEDTLKAFHDVEVSVDLPTEAEQDQFRGCGNWRDVHAAIARCQRLGIEVSVLATLMNTNYGRMDDLLRLARSLGANLRVNVYQSVRNDRFRLDYVQFWEGYRRLLGAGQLLSCSEPVVRASLGLEEVRSPCGHRSVRITPQRRVAPCVYWPGDALTLDDLQRLGEGILQTTPFKQATTVPEAARACRCQGGCASRRALAGTLNSHDAYCPWVRGEEAHLDHQWAAPVETQSGGARVHLPRAENVCTTIMV